MVLSHWRIITDTKRPEAAERLAAKLQARVDHAFCEAIIDDCHKGGHVVAFDLEHDFNDWAAAVYHVICCAQRMGHGWSISGFVDEELGLITTGTSIAGIKMVSCYGDMPEAQRVAILEYVLSKGSS